MYHSPSTITEGVVFHDGFDNDRLVFNEELGFLQVDEALLAFGSIRLLGFGAPIARSGGVDIRQTVRPITELSELPADAKTISLQGKGVGARLYNTPQGALGLPNPTDIIGAYVVSIQPDRMLDIRPEAGSFTRQIARHAGRIIASRATSLDNVVEKIHARYGDADAVLLKQPPHPAILQLLRGAKNPDGIPGEFIIVRNSNTLLRKVGVMQTGR